VKTSLAALVLLLGASPSSAADGIPRWEGRWAGTLRNLPVRPGAPLVRIERETGPWPAAGACTRLVTRYLVEGKPTQTKDYRLCRGAGSDDLWVDEGDGMTLSARLLGDVLVAPFKYGDILLVASTRVEGDQMVEEILSAKDSPATKGIVKLTATNLQRLELARLPQPDAAPAVR
jgi:hypothetical protein